MTMKDIVKYIIELCIKTIQTFFFIIIVVITSKRTKIKKIYKESCAILGNSESFPKDLEYINRRFEKMDLICVNTFALYDYFEIAKPRIYVIYDPKLWSMKNEKLKQSNKKLFENISKTTTWPLTIYAPYSFENSEFSKYLSKNNNIEIKLYNGLQVEGFNWFIFVCLKYNLALPRAANVIVPSINFAINSGYKNIYLLGVKHDWPKYLTVGEDNVVKVEQRHFYDNDKIDIASPIYLTVKDELDKNPAKIHELLGIWSHLFEGYFLLKKYAMKNGSNIINLSENSLIDAFDKSN